VLGGFLSRRRFRLIEDVEFFAWLESYRFAGCDVYLGSGPGIAPDTGLAGPDIEDSETAKLDAVAVGERLFERLEYGVHCGLSLHTRQSGAFDHVMDDVLFNQCLHPEPLLSLWYFRIWCDARKVFAHCQRADRLVRCKF
jgi:hypothetical protein